MPFLIDSPDRKLNGDLCEEMILEHPEDESLLIMASGMSLNTTHLVGNPLMQSELDSVLSLQPEKLNL